MTPRSLGLASRLIDGAAPHPVWPQGLDYDVRDTLVRLTLGTGELGTLSGAEVRVIIRLAPATRAFASRRPDALWVADLRAGQDGGCIVPFAPPRSAQLDVAVPVRVPDHLVDELQGVGLRRGMDLLRSASIPLGDGLRVAILGQQTLAALDEDDARRVTWWLPSGEALELHVVLSATRTVTLVLDGVVRLADTASAHCGPNVILELGRLASAPLDPGPSVSAPSSSEARALLPPRSPLFDIWARYTRILREVSAERQAARMACPLTFGRATADGRRWRAEVSMEDDALRAWLGANVQEGRPVKVDQPVALVDPVTRDELGRFAVERAWLRGPGVVEISLAAVGGARHLPQEGVLEARENKGEKVRLEREHAAAELLTRGLAACERLPALLAAPESARPPVLRPLPQASHALLDEHQERAVQLVFGCEDIVLIQGPPGTGKTRVIAESLRQIVAANRDRGHAVRVLVSSVQNEAVANVIDRIADAEGVVIHLVQRSARDEDEGFGFARVLDEQRRQLVTRLGEALSSSDIASRLARVRAAESGLDELLLELGGPPERLDRVPALLRNIAADPEPLLPVFLREEATRLAGLLEASPPSPAPGPSQPPSLPADPEQVSSWWQAAQSGWPASDHAALGAAVQAVEEALRRPPAVRELLLPRRWEALRRLAVLPMYAPVDQGPVPPTASELVDAWAVSARRALNQVRAQVEGHPDAVRARFLQVLQEDPRAWSRIVERHGNTVTATCSMSAKATLEPGEAYDWVIIDEAGRASPFELLIPMVQGRRVVLIGDHRQLPPSVEDAFAQLAMEEGTQAADLRVETLFGELFRLVPSGCRARLGIQYRMHEAIGHLVNELFYLPHGEALLSHHAGPRAVERQSRLGLFEDRPVVWDEVAPAGHCKEENGREAERLVALVRAYAAAGAGPDEVAIICPYQAQRARIQNLLRSLPPAERAVAQVRTIDAVQGREYPVVILGLVRTDGRPGFLTSPNRLNVAISRAQRQLVVVGSAMRFLDTPLVRRNAPHLYQLVARISRQNLGGGHG